MAIDNLYYTGLYTVQLQGHLTGGLSYGLNFREKKLIALFLFFFFKFIKSSFMN